MEIAVGGRGARRSERSLRCHIMETITKLPKSQKKFNVASLTASGDRYFLTKEQINPFIYKRIKCCYAERSGETDTLFKFFVDVDRVGDGPPDPLKYVSDLILDLIRTSILRFVPRVEMLLCSKKGSCNFHIYSDIGLTKSQYMSVITHINSFKCKYYSYEYNLSPNKLWILPLNHKLNEVEHYEGTMLFTAEHIPRSHVHPGEGIDEGIQIFDPCCDIYQHLTVTPVSGVDYTPYLIYFYDEERTFVNHYVFNVILILHYSKLGDGYSTWMRVAYCLINMIKKLTQISKKRQLESILRAAWLNYSSRSKKFDLRANLRAWDNFTENETLHGALADLPPLQHLVTLFAYSRDTIDVDDRELLTPVKYTLSFLTDERGAPQLIDPSHAMIAEFFQYVNTDGQYFFNPSNSSYYKYNSSSGLYDCMKSISLQLFQKVSIFQSYVKRPTTNIQNMPFLKHCISYYNELVYADLNSLVSANHLLRGKEFNHIGDLLDMPPNVLHFKNGVLNLDTDSGRLKRYRACDFATKPLPFHYFNFFKKHAVVWDAPGYKLSCMKGGKRLEGFVGSDSGISSNCSCPCRKRAIKLIKYLHDIFGPLYGEKQIELFNILRTFLHGDNRLKLALVLVGPKDTGKSVFCNLLNSSLSHYASVIDYSFFETKGKRGGGDATVQLNSMDGKRIVRCNEVNANPIATDQFKSHTGNDLQYKRRLYQEATQNFTPPPYSFVFAGNIIPNINILDIPAWQRLYIYSLENRIFEPVNDLSWLCKDNIPSLFLDFLINFKKKKCRILSNSEQWRRGKCPLYKFIGDNGLHNTPCEELYNIYMTNYIDVFSERAFRLHGLSYQLTFNSVFNACHVDVGEVHKFGKGKTIPPLTNECLGRRPVESSKGGDIEKSTPLAPDCSVRTHDDRQPRKTLNVNSRPTESPAHTMLRYINQFSSADMSMKRRATEEEARGAHDEKRLKK